MTQLTTSERIGLTAAPDAVQLAPGSQITIVLSVTNAGSIVDQFGLMVEGLDPTWFSVREGMVNLFPGAMGTLQLDIHLPDGPEAVAGTHAAILRVISHEVPSDAATVTVPINILAIGGFQASIAPQRVRVGWRGTAHYVISLNNTGNDDALLDLALRDPEEALEFKVSPDRVSVPHGSSAEATVTGRPRARPLVSLERSYAFTVDAVRSLPSTDAETQATETLAVVVGELVYHPPLATLAALPLSLRRLLMALAALAVLAALLIWFLAAPGRRGALIAQVPATKPVVAAAETALNLPQPVAGGAGAGGAGAGGAGGEAPKVVKFELSTPAQNGQTGYALVWQVDGADQVKIDGTPQPDPQSGTVPLSKLDKSEYVLQATKGNVSVNQSVGIVILRPPDVQSFVANPDTVAPGQPSTLRWQAARAVRATIGDQTVDPNLGTLQVTPTTTTTYTLTVENDLGTTDRSVEVKVQGVAPAPGPSPSPSPAR
jgi:hypothetical protein